MEQAKTGCGGGGASCGCGGGGGGKAALDEPVSVQADPHASDIVLPVATVNGIPLHGAAESPDPESLRQRAYSELLRQAAQRDGFLADADRPALDGVQSEAASNAIELLLESQIRIPEPDVSACRRFFDAHQARFSIGEKVLTRHILFAVTPGVDVAALRQRAEALLLALRCADIEAFAKAAAETSNCPSGAEGGALGWLARTDCAPEFAAALFAQDLANAHVGVLPRLVSTRFGFHIVLVEAREAGQAQTFEAVQAAIKQTLRQQAYVTALRQFLNLLAGEALIEGLELEGADSPLLQ